MFKQSVGTISTKRVIDTMSKIVSVCESNDIENSGNYKLINNVLNSSFIYEFNTEFNSDIADKFGITKEEYEKCREVYIKKKKYISDNIESVMYLFISIMNRVNDMGVVMKTIYDGGECNEPQVR